MTYFDRNCPTQHVLLTWRILCVDILENMKMCHLQMSLAKDIMSMNKIPFIIIREQTTNTIMRKVVQTYHARGHEQSDNSRLLNLCKRPWQYIVCSGISMRKEIHPRGG